MPKIKCRRNKDGSKTWWAEWFEPPLKPGGPRKHRSVVLGDARKISKQTAKQRLQDALDDGASTQSTTNVRAFVQAVWLPEMTRRVTWNTLRNVKSRLNMHILPTFGEMKIGDIRKAHVEEWLRVLADRKYRRWTAEALLTQFRSIMLAALDNEIIGRNPADRVRLPEMRRAEETPAYTEAEVRFLSAQTGADGLLLRVLLFCGLRPGEALALVPGDVEGRLLKVSKSLDNSGAVKGTKTGRPRAVSLPPVLAGELAALAETTPAGERIFGTWRNVCLLQKGLRERFRAVIPEFLLRRCRTTFATLYRGDPADVQALLGHSTLGMTMDHYRRAIPERQAEAVAELERRATEKERVQ